METWKKILLLTGCGLLVPLFARSQGLSEEVAGLHQVLGTLYAEMVPLCGDLIGIGQGIAGFAATWYIGSRVWRHIANAEPVDLYPLFRPFVLGFAILLFPAVLDLLNGVLQPTVTATSGMVRDADKAIKVLLQQREEAIRQTNAWQMYVGESGGGDRDRWYKYTHDEQAPAGEGILESIGNDIRFAMEKASYSFRHSVKEWMSEVLRLVYEAAALCLNTIRTFQLVVLALLGPLVFGLAVFDGFQHTLTVWIARYINVYLWLPVANLFGAVLGRIQEKMVSLDISQLEGTGNTFFTSTDTAYLIFLVMGIVGYFTVPSVAGYIVHAGGGNALLYKVNNLLSATSHSTVQAVSHSTSLVRTTIGDAASRISGGQGSAGHGRGAGTGPSRYLQGRLRGK